MENLELRILISLNNKKIDLDVVERILVSILESKSLKITNIAMRSRLNYKRCVKYIQMLSECGLISIKQDVISVSQQGRELLDLIQKIRNCFSLLHIHARTQGKYRG